MELRAVLLDATGTLIELATPVGETYADAAAMQGVALPAWRVQDAFERVMRRAEPRVYPGQQPDQVARSERAWWDDLVRQTFQAADSTIRFTDFAALAGGLFAHYEGAAAWRLRTGALSMLDAFDDAGWRTGVVSNFDLRLPRLLDALGLGDRFTSITLPAHCGARKPDPVIFRAALHTLGVDASEALLLGDDPEKDLAGARAVGLMTLDVRELTTLDEAPRKIRDLARMPAQSARDRID
jgi:putative hydrolase of the HAD superfamily